MLGFFVSFSPFSKCQVYTVNYCVFLPVSFQIYFNPTHHWWPVVCSPLTFNHLFNIKTLFIVSHSKCGGSRWIPYSLLVVKSSTTLLPFWLYVLHKPSATLLLMCAILLLITLLLEVLKMWPKNTSMGPEMQTRTAWNKIHFHYNISTSQCLIIIIKNLRKLNREML